MGGTRRKGATALLVSALVCGWTAAAAQAQEEGESCLQADAPPIDAPANPLRFGITPLTAGSAGASQLEPVPHDDDRDVAGALGLRPEGKQLVMRMNRMFMADGVEGIRRYAEIVDRYAEAGLDSELQVRYHPPEEQEGDMAAWESYVRDAARILGRRESVTALSITNEANFSVSPNTSDGAYEGVREAIVVGTVAARDELDRIGREDVELGFSFAWRWVPSSDRAFWEEIGALATPEFRQALDYVGVQVYPHLVWPPAPLPGRTAGDEIVEALTLLRDCYMPKAGIGDEVDLWVSENGYATNLGRTEESQAESLRASVESVHAFSGTLGVTDYRWFNLRDNRTGGPDLFDSVGLLRDDYSEKPAYATFRELVASVGADRAPDATASKCRGRAATIEARGRRVRGTEAADVIVAGNAADRVAGKGGDDLICARGGNDRIGGGKGDDLLAGGRGADRLKGGGGRDRCHGGRGRDSLKRCER
jgi:hypothetical protein